MQSLLNVYNELIIVDVEVVGARGIYGILIFKNNVVRIPLAQLHS